MDDLSWYDLGVKDQTVVFESISMTSLILCAACNLYRKSKYDHILKELFIFSQLRFMIPWSLTILTSILFFDVFGCW